METPVTTARMPSPLSWRAFSDALRAGDIDALAFAALAGTLFGIAFSIALGQMLAACCFALTVTGLGLRRIRWRWPAGAWWAAAFGVAAVASILRGVDPHHLWDKAGELCWLLLIPVTAMLVTSPGRARRLVLAFVAGCAVQGLESVVGNPFRAWRHPTYGFLAALIDLGSMTDGQMLMLGLSITLVLLVLTWRTEQRLPVALLLAFLLELAGLVINFKRGSWFCAVLLAGGFVLSHARWRTGVLLLAALALLAALPPVRARLGQLEREFNADGGGRLTMWCRVTPALIQAHPGGVGYGALTNDLMRKACRRVEPNRNHVHANWAQILVETGWPGFAVYAGWMIWLAVGAVRWVRSARIGPVTHYAVALSAFMALAGLLLNGLVEYNFGDAELMMVLSVFAGLIAGRSQRTEDRGQRSEDRGQRSEDRGQRTEYRGHPGPRLNTGHRASRIRC